MNQHSHNKLKPSLHSLISSPPLLPHPRTQPKTTPRCPTMNSNDETADNISSTILHRHHSQLLPPSGTESSAPRSEINYDAFTRFWTGVRDDYVANTNDEVLAAISRRGNESIPN